MFINLATRGATLVLRFALSFYIVSYMGLKAAGIYGLAVGTAGIMPALIGWGLNYFVLREVVGQTPAEAAPLIRDRLVITFLSLVLSSLLFIPWIWMAPPGLAVVYAMILALVWLETIALDIYMPLIGLELGDLGNFLVFVRSALWVPILIALGLADPRFRNLETLFGCWILFHLLAYAILWFALRRWPIRARLSKPVHLRWAFERFRDNWYIYVSDIGLVGVIFIDRYIVSYMLGLEPMGIYTFYWSLTNALQTLTMTAVVQLALPRLVRSLGEGAGQGWRHELRVQATKTVAFSFVMSLCVYGATELIFRVSPPGRFPVDRLLFALMLLAAVVRSGSDLLNVALTSLKEDKSYAATNFIGMLITVLFGFIFMHEFGLLGAGIAMFATSCALLLLRGGLLAKVYRSGIRDGRIADHGAMAAGSPNEA